jgi:hypothetical protein
MPIRALDCELGDQRKPEASEKLMLDAREFLLYQVLLQDKKLVKEAPLSALRDTRLGIDATLYVRRLLTSSETKEAYVPALGGVPLALEEHILRDLRTLEKEHIKPIFVFNGLAPQKGGSPRERSAAAAAAEDTRPAKRQIAWEHYEKGRNQAALAAFQELSIGVADVLRVVHRCFMHRKTEFITAPYLAWAQVRPSSDSFCLNSC